MAKILKCANPDCGAEFEAIPINRKYCCAECKAIMDKKRWSARGNKAYKQSIEREKAEQKKKERKQKALGEISAEAKKAGMTYGKYVAMYGL